MVDHIQAIYENGQLRLLSPVELSEGQIVQITIESVPTNERLRLALGDIVGHWPDKSDDSDAHLEDLAAEIDEALQGEIPLSQIIINNRGEV